MKKIVLAVLVALVTQAANAQKLIVYSLMGKVEDVTASKARKINLRDALTLNTVLNIPYQGSIVLYDEVNSKQYTLKTPGRATVKDMIADNRNSVQQLTSDYLAFIKKQISSGGQVMLRNCSDPATVTRSLMITTPDDKNGSDLLLCGTDGFSDKSKSKKDISFKDDFKAWKNQMLQDYQAFRKQMLDDYANFVRNPWENMKLTPAEEKPMDELIKPVVIEEKIDPSVIEEQMDEPIEEKVEEPKKENAEQPREEKIEQLKEEKVEEPKEEKIDQPKEEKLDNQKQDQKKEQKKEQKKKQKKEQVEEPREEKPVEEPKKDILKEQKQKQLDTPIEEKKEEEVKPLDIDDKGGKSLAPNFDKIGRRRSNKITPLISILPMPQPMPTPEPIAPIKENPEVVTDQYRTFVFFGTEMKVRWSDDCAFRLNSLKEGDIADAITLLSDSKYDNLLYDCIQLRSTHHLSDWAYYLMLKEVGNTLCGKGTNEATLLQAMLYSQSGYKLRFAKTKDKLLLMVSTQFHLYGYSYLVLDGHNFYLLDEDCESIDICRAKFPQEQEMSLIMAEAPQLTNNKSDVRTFASGPYPELKAEVCVNKNLLDFYSTYPSSYFNNDFMTRWAMYANKEMQPEIKEQLYPQLKAMIEGKSQREKAEKILNWIQTSFEYEYDETVWGHDRAFFAEESLFYPYCDCEDRSILFTRLIRDLVGLKCILVFYPGHLATAIHFTEDVKGDYIEVKGERYTVCDPTIMGCGAPVGWTMSGMDNSSANVIVLE